MKDISVVILAGGLATRMRPITEKIPKSLIEVNGKPFIDYQLKLLEDNNIHHIVLSVGYLGEMLEEHTNTLKTSLKTDYVYDGPKLLGTGGAVKKALPLLSDNFVVLYGDSYLNVPLAPIIKSFIENESNFDGLMTVFKNEDQYDTSNVIFKNNQIIKYSKTEKSPEMNYIDWGLSLFNKKAFLPFQEEETFDLSDVFINLVEQQRLLPYEVHERFYEIGSKQGLSELSALLK